MKKSKNIIKCSKSAVKFKANRYLEIGIFW